MYRYEIAPIIKLTVLQGKSEVSMLMTTKESTLQKLDLGLTANEPEDNYILEDKSIITYKVRYKKLWSCRMLIPVLKSFIATPTGSNH